MRADLCGLFRTILARISAVTTGIGGVDSPERTDNDDGTDGTLVNIAAALFEAGVELDPDDPPSYTELSFHDAYGHFPILLKNL